jgi:hypothetical protein
MENKHLKRLKNSIEKLNVNSKEMELVMKALIKNSEKLNYKDRTTLNKNLKELEQIESQIDNLE